MNPEFQDLEGLDEAGAESMVALRRLVLQEGTQNITWDDVCGLENVKEGLEEAIILPRKHPHLFKAIDQAKGVLLYGPPGTGKTMLARALSAYAGCTFLCATASSLVSKWLGDSSKNIRLLFTMARNRSPAIIFIDEIDTIAPNRELERGSHGGQMLGELLQQMDGFDSSVNRDVWVVAATNCRDDIDRALLRRFNKHILVPNPGCEAREQILKAAFKKADYSMEGDQLKRLVTETAKISGSAVKDLATKVLLVRARKIITQGEMDIQDSELVTQALLSIEK